MKKKDGFTLMELLIAAAILSALLVFATQSFRQSASDIRVEDAKVRAGAIAAAAQRLKIDYPNATFLLNENMGFVSGPRETDTVGCDVTNVDLDRLVQCGYLNYRQYAVDRVNGNVISHFEFKFVDNNGKVCISGASGRILTDSTICTTDGVTFTEEAA